MNNEANILIGGDFAPIKRYNDYFSFNKLEILDNNLIDEIRKSDFFLVNLESPLYKIKKKRQSSLPQLIANPSVVNGMGGLGIDACCLSNNHILDAQNEGLYSTIEHLEAHGIDYFGAGSNRYESNELYIREINGYRIGFYAISNNEFSIATAESPGANPENLIDWFYEIPKLKKGVDFLIVIYHTGINRSIFPSPNLQKKSKLLVDLGADLVTCQHSHIIGTYENYNGKKIIYGQGDFIFDYGLDINDFRIYGSILKVNISGKSLDVDIIYFKRKGIHLKVLNGDERVSLENKMNLESRKLDNLEFIKEEYENLLRKKENSYLNLFLSYGNIFLLKILNKFNISNLFFTKNYSKILLNIIQNDIHRNMLIKILRKKL